MLRVATLCSGIGAPEVAFKDCEFVFAAEIDPFASAVLAHHYPNVPNLGDITKIDGRQWRGKVDLLIGGPPCQAFSMAGERKSLDDERGQLTFEYVRLLDQIQPSVAVYENVKGLLSDKQNAWGKFLALVASGGGELQPPGRRWGNAGLVVGSKRAIAWRVLNAQHFGLAQRRSRVYAVIVDPRNLGRLVARHPDLTIEDWHKSREKLFLSPKSRSGILRRANRRGKKLDPLLEEALKKALNIRLHSPEPSGPE
ncbi:MAG: DNA cytosine methyltransferase [Richelia sp. CSU_2_1]|nr:DNA cytosine methyltransferase [Richelia sp. CSU_2_1]